MSLFTIEEVEITDIPARRRSDFRIWRGRLSDADYQAVVEEINRRIDANGGRDVVVSSFLPGNDWTGTPFEPLYHACHEDIQASGWFFGLIMWQTIIDRDDVWYFMKTEMPDREILGITYFRSQADRKN